MKTNKLAFIFSLISLLTLSGCSPEEDIKTPDLIPLFFNQDFSSFTTDDEDIQLENWTNFAEAGTVKWKQGIFSSSKYAEFSGFRSGQVSNIGWLISPAINMDKYKNEALAFQIAQAYVSSSANSIELFVSSDFDGTNVLAANWEQKTFTLPPLNFDTNFDFFDSGVVDLSTYTGKIYIAFKVKGSGTNAALDGTYEIDNIRIFSKE